jgi:hypothetical protein
MNSFLFLISQLLTTPTNFVFITCVGTGIAIAGAGKEHVVFRLTDKMVHIVDYLRNWRSWNWS